MSYPRIGFRRMLQKYPGSFATWALALAAHCSCAGGGGGSQVRGDGPDLSGDILKITYFRAFEHPQTKKLEPTYRMILSASWVDRIGESAREPLPLAAPSNIYRGTVPDEKVRRYVAKVRELGLDDLVSRPPESFRPEELNRFSQHPTESEFTRIFTIGTEKNAKSYYYRDQQRSKEQIEKFRSCERFILSIMNGETIRVQTRSDPVFRKDQ